MIRDYHSLAWWTGVFLILVLIMVGGNMTFTLWQVSTSQKQMCKVLEAVPPPHEASTPTAIEFFSRLKVLEKQYGCVP